jgi:hypothetical protein
VSGASLIKQQLLAKLNVKNEIDELLGGGKGNSRSCFNKVAHKNGDKSPSLTFNPDHGGWKCHSCGESGSIIDLHMKVKNAAFRDVFKHLLEKYHVKPTNYGATKSESKSRKWSTLTDPRKRGSVTKAALSWTHTRRGPERAKFMLERYGLTLDTLQEYWIGFHATGKRVTIPIFSGAHRNVKRPHMLPELRNIRYHDAFRLKCSWMNMDTKEVSHSRPDSVTDAMIIGGNVRPWKTFYPADEKTGKRKGGKVTNVYRFGGPYPYPFSVAMENTTLTLVGGEFKALLLNQIGMPTFTFGAEGAIDTHFLPQIIGKRVNVLYDADPEKTRDNDDLSPIDHQAIKMAQILANHGADAAWGYWPKEVREVLPKGGDVTDWLRMCGWNPEALNVIEWRKVEYKSEEAQKPDVLSTGEEVPPLGAMRKIPLHGVTSPGNYNKWVRFRAMVAGRLDSPYVVPSSVTASCDTVNSGKLGICAGCPLTLCGYKRMLTLDTTTQIDYVAIPRKQMEKSIRQAIGVPRACKEVDVNPDASAAEILTLIPTIDAQEGGLDMSPGSVDRERSISISQRIYALDGDNERRMQDNKSFFIGGKTIMDPISGKYTFAAVEWEPVDDDVFSYRHDPTMAERLATATRRELASVNEQMDMMTGEVRDYVVNGEIHGADTMLVGMWLAMFLPFSYKIGQQWQARICPAVMVLGDTNTGKSTTWRQIMRYYGTGRMVAGESRPTLAGLIGGAVSNGNRRQEFMWGVLPTSHLGAVAIDEYNKVSLDLIGELTSTLSSGIAERRIVGGTKRTQSWVRLLYLCNPRSKRRLTSYDNMLSAALGVAGTVQDLGRVDYCIVQPPVTDMSAFTRQHKPAFASLYPQDLAKYHLSWAWTRKPADIVIEDVDYLFAESIKMSNKLGQHVLLLPAQARFKVSRIAAGVATALYSSCDKGEKVIVTKAHINWALKFLEQLYSPHIKVSTASVAAMPSELSIFLDKNVPTSHLYKLRRLCHGTSYFTIHDFEEVFGGNNRASMFLEEAYYKHALLRRTRRGYSPQDTEAFSDMFRDYMNERERHQVMQRSPR